MKYIKRSVQLQQKHANITTLGKVNNTLSTTINEIVVNKLSPYFAAPFFFVKKYICVSVRLCAL